MRGAAAGAPGARAAAPPPCPAVAGPARRRPARRCGAGARAAGQLTGIDTSGIRLRLNRDVWLADILLAALPAADGSEWVVGGDFNLSETFDAWPGGPRGNREYLDRIADRGFTECLRKTTGRVTPTFRNPSNGAVIHQMDHLFATSGLADRLTRCEVGSADRVFGLRLSDHLPIVADFLDAA